MIDTFNTVPSAVKAYSWWDFAKYTQQPYTFYADAYVAVNLAWWNRLPRDLQELIEDKIAPGISKEATAGVMDYSNQVLEDFAKDRGGQVSRWSDDELRKMVTINREQVWPKIAKEIDPDLYRAAKEFVGHE